MLTLETLKNMEPHRIIARGQVLDHHDDGVSIAGTGKWVRWVAKRGGIHDWAIYIQNPHYGELERDYPDVMARGDKLVGECNIKRLVPCDDEAFKMYRR